jgi:hypothetical protein
VARCCRCYVDDALLQQILDQPVEMSMYRRLYYEERLAARRALYYGRNNPSSQPIPTKR